MHVLTFPEPQPQPRKAKQPDTESSPREIVTMNKAPDKYVVAVGDTVSVDADVSIAANSRGVIKWIGRIRGESVYYAGVIMVRLCTALY